MPLGRESLETSQAASGDGWTGAERSQEPCISCPCSLCSILAASLLHRPVDQLFPALSPQLLALLSAAQGEEALEENLNGVSQKQISYKVDSHQQKLLLQQFQEDEVRERARLASVSLPHAGDWLVVAPLPALGLHL